MCNDGKKLAYVPEESCQITVHGKPLTKRSGSHVSGMMRMTSNLEQDPFESWQPEALSSSSFHIPLNKQVTIAFFLALTL